jgi:hypothetical protein
MRRLLVALLALLAAGTVTGCGGDRDKGVYRDQDRPRAPDRGDKDR